MSGGSSGFSRHSRPERVSLAFTEPMPKPQGRGTTSAAFVLAHKSHMEATESQLEGIAGRKEDSHCFSKSFFMPITNAFLFSSEISLLLPVFNSPASFLHSVCASPTFYLQSLSIQDWPHCVTKQSKSHCPLYVNVSATELNHKSGVHLTFDHGIPRPFGYGINNVTHKGYIAGVAASQENDICHNFIARFPHGIGTQI